MSERTRRRLLFMIPVFLFAGGCFAPEPKLIGVLLGFAGGLIVAHLIYERSAAVPEKGGS